MENRRHMYHGVECHRKDAQKCRPAQQQQCSCYCRALLAANWLATDYGLVNRSRRHM